jgi:hypothetical protein
MAMTDVRRGGNRRIDRVLDPDYLADLPAQSLSVLRDKRREAEQEETELSYLRRLLHGRIDMVRAEQARRSGHGRPVVEERPGMLADTSRATRAFDKVRHLVTEPTRLDRRRRRVERLVSDVDLSDVAARTDDELARVLRTYEDEERQVSAVRTAVQQVLDACAAELHRRYTDGEASVAELLDAELDEEQRGRA